MLDESSRSSHCKCAGELSGDVGLLLMSFDAGALCLVNFLRFNRACQIDVEMLCCTPIGQLQIGL